MVENRGKLMWASFLTLIAAGMGFGVRTGTLAEWAKEFGFTQFELGTITGGGLVGFGVVILAASFITDRVGYKTILLVAFLYRDGQRRDRPMPVLGHFHFRDC